MHMESRSLQHGRTSYVTTLNKILEVEGKLDPSEEKENNGILEEFLHTFIECMKKQDKLFDILYQDIHYTGSYYSNLRIAEPNEYDLNLVMKLPFEEVNVDDFKRLRKLFYKQNNLMRKKWYCSKQRNFQKSGLLNTHMKKNNHQSNNHYFESSDNKNIEDVLPPKQFNHQRPFKKQNVICSGNYEDVTNAASKSERSFDSDEMDLKQSNNNSYKFRNKRKHTKNIAVTSKNNVTDNIKTEVSASKPSSICKQRMKDSKSLTKIKRNLYCDFKRPRKLFYKQNNLKRKKWQKCSKQRNFQKSGLLNTHMKKNNHQSKNHYFESSDNKNIEDVLSPKQFNHQRPFKMQIVICSGSYEDVTNATSKSERSFDSDEMDLKQSSNHSYKFRNKRKHTKNIADTSKNNVTDNIKTEVSASKPSSICKQRMKDSKSLTKIKRNLYCVKYHEQVPSYVKYHIFDGNFILRKNGLAKLFENWYLIPEKVLHWMQSVVDKALSAYPYPDKVIKITCKKSGPATTIVLEKRNGAINIDLVPVVEHTVKCMPPGIDSRIYDKVKDNPKCFLVPKLYPPTRKPAVNEAERVRLWRAHYPKVENELIHDLGCVKPVIKLLKLLRDKEKWEILASYYLKTIVMWMVLENSDPEHWKMDHIGERFLDALENLAKCVVQQKICYFFSSGYNLLQELPTKQACDIYNKLRSMIRAIQRDDRELWTVFRCSPRDD